MILDICWKSVISMLGRATFLLMMSYLCEAGYLAVAMIKSKCWAKISVEQEMRRAVSNLVLNLRSLTVPNRRIYSISKSCGY